MVFKLIFIVFQLFSLAKLSILLANLGASFAYFVVTPLAFDFFLGFQQPGSLESGEASEAGTAGIAFQGSAQEYLSLTIKFIIAFGLCFQLPVLLTLMGKAGLVSSAGLKNVRKFAIVGILVLAALVTPPDVITQIILFVVVYGLYEVSIFLVGRTEKQINEKFAADDMPPAISLRTATDLRWTRRDIKSTNLLAQVMAKHAANEAGDYEALMIDQDGYVTEAGSSSFFFIKDNKLFIRPVTNEILHGITRQTMLRVAQQMDLKFVESIYKLDEVLRADEALITASSIYVLPVSKIDDHVIADGKAGRFTVALRKAYLEIARAEFYQPTDS